jgi:hypothetical protein
MQQIDNLELKRRELVNTAQLMLTGEMNLLEGTRCICELRFSVGDPENEVFLPIRAVDSETDHFPLGAIRASCSPEYLMRADDEMQTYLNDMSKDILQACSKMVEAFS